MTLPFRFSPGALGVLAGLAIPITSLTAAPIPAPVAGELYLAFRAGGRDGASDSYIIKLGADTTFRNAAAGTSFPVSGLGNIAADLTSSYGPDWNTRDDLFWGIFGVRSSASSIVYASRERSPAAAESIAWNALDLISRNSTASQITSVLESIGGYKGREATANSAVATFQANGSNASSYAKQVATPGTTDFGSLSEWSSVEGNFGGGASATALDLYRIAGSGVTRVGKFTISNAGVVTFTAPAAAPTNVDTDGDGQPDSEEALAGTNPADPSDFFRIQSVVLSSSAATVTFNTVPARGYKVYYREDLGVGSWELIGEVTGGASPEFYQFVDTDPVRKARPRGFYKIGVNQ